MDGLISAASSDLRDPSLSDPLLGEVLGEGLRTRALNPDGLTPDSLTPGGLGSDLTSRSLAFDPRPNFGGLTMRRLADVEALVIGKTTPGFDSADLAAVKRVVRNAAAGRLGRIKFLVLDFHIPALVEGRAPDGVAELAAEIADLILYAPVITLAYVRGEVGGADLELALACSMVVAEKGSNFGFSADPVLSVGVYALLAQKIGFVRAERLMEREGGVDAETLREMLVIKEVLEPGVGVEGLEGFLTRSLRRHNAACGIYRAQRIAAPVPRGALNLA